MDLLPDQTDDSEYCEMDAMSDTEEWMLTSDSSDQAFENTSTSVAASQMRNALNNLADTVTEPKDKQVCEILRS